MTWQLVAIACGSILGGEAWIALRDKVINRGHYFVKVDGVWVCRDLGCTATR